MVFDLDSGSRDVRCCWGYGWLVMLHDNGVVRVEPVMFPSLPMGFCIFVLGGRVLDRRDKNAMHTPRAIGMGGEV